MANAHNDNDADDGRGPGPGGGFCVSHFISDKHEGGGVASVPRTENTTEDQRPSPRPCDAAENRRTMLTHTWRT